MSWVAWLGLGLLIGVGATLVATILFLLLLGLARIAITAWRSRQWRQSAIAGLSLVGAAFVGMSPVWMHNTFVAHDPVLLSAHGGINFWIGNYPEANGYPKIPKDLPAAQEALLQVSIRAAEDAAGHPLRRSEVSKYWSQKAWDSIRQDPARWFALLGIKIRNFWNAYSYDDLTIVALLREEGVLLPGIGFGIIAAFGLAGLVIGLTRNSCARWVAAAVLLLMASLLTVFITERYRLPSVPGLLVLGSYGLWWFGASLVSRDWRGAILYVALLCCTMAVVFLPRTDAPQSMEIYNLGIAELEAGQLDRAEQHLRQAQAIAPRDPALLSSLGALYQTKGDRELARNFYRKSLVYDPQNNQALSNLATLAMEDRLWDEAEKFLLAAVKSDPLDHQSYYLLAIARYEAHNLAGAREAVDAALRLSPRDPNYLGLRAKLAQTPP